jgi:hypothetical protein
VSESRGTLGTLAQLLASLLDPLKERLDADDLPLLLAELGLQLPPAFASAPAVHDAGGSAAAKLDELPDLIAEMTAAFEADNSIEGLAKAVQLAAGIADVSTNLGRLGTALPGAAAGAGIPAAELSQFADQLPRRLLDYLLVRRLEGLPGVADALEFAGAVERVDVPGTDAQHPGFTRRSFDFAALMQFASDPRARLEAKYGWGSGAFDGTVLLQTLDRILKRAGLPHVLDTTGATPVLDVLAFEVKPRLDLSPRGLSATIAHPLAFPQTTYQQEGWKVELQPEVQLGQGAEIVLSPDDGIRFVPSSGAPQGKLFVEWTGGALDGDPYIIAGQPGSSRLEARQLVARAGAVLSPQGGAGVGDLRLSAQIRGGRVVIDLAGGDGFLKKVLAGVNVDSSFEVGLGFSTRDGLFFEGSAALEIQVPLHVALGPVELTALTLSAGLENAAIPVGAAVDLKAQLGPITGVVQGVGAEILLSLPPDQRGTIGPVDLALRFKPPKGIGLAVDAGPVKGGGYLYIDADRGEYAGALELTFSGIVALKAIGLITTRMPDGSEGFSLLIVITAEFGTGIQLGFGFTLLAVGGVLGLNRRMALEPLIQGVKTNAISSVMFPQDVIANAPQIISDLRSFFPPQEGTFVIGPMAKLGWGTPTLVSLSLGVIIEIPGNIAILGVLKVALPTEELAVIKLQVNFAGAIEFDRKRVYFFAALFDSRIVFLTIEGEMAVLAAFGDDANFVLSVGGFHPSFTPPPLPVPTPRRIAVDIINRPGMKLRVEGYLAVTTNTAQFGARVDAQMGFDECGIQGYLAFDALVQFSPLHFVVTISASVSMKVFGAGLFSVNLRFDLEGPSPWRARGSASLSLLFFDIDVDFDVTFGEARDTELPPVAVMPMVAAELGKVENWRAILPPGNNLMVSLRALDPAADTLVLHPVGVLQVSQRAVPLDLTIARVGSQKPTDVKKLGLKVTSSDLAKRGDVEERFAPAQFQDFSDAEKLGKPAFQKMHGGIELSAEGEQLRSGQMVKRVVRYELITIDGAFRKHQRFRNLYALLFSHWIKGAAVSRLAISQAAKEKLVPFDEKVKVLGDPFVVASVADNVAVASFASEAMAQEHLQSHLTADPTAAGALHVIPAFEAIAA